MKGVGRFSSREEATPAYKKQLQRDKELEEELVRRGELLFRVPYTCLDEDKMAECVLHMLLPMYCKAERVPLGQVVRFDEARTYTKAHRALEQTKNDSDTD